MPPMRPLSENCFSGPRACPGQGYRQGGDCKKEQHKKGLGDGEVCGVLSSRFYKLYNRSATTKQTLI